MALAERIVEWAEGYKAEGLQRGMQQGMQQGEALALQKLLSKRFGALSADMATQIASASLEQIESWFDKAIDAVKLDDVFGGAA